jgi:tRNA-dihydrouridine synthase 1
LPFRADKAQVAQAHSRRKGAAFLDEVRTLKQAVSIPVLSNGNVRTWDDAQANLASTGADGVMSGVGLLRNP